MEQQKRLRIATSLAACHSFLQHRYQKVIFNPASPALVALWNEQGAQLASLPPVWNIVQELVELVSPAWSVEAGGGGDVSLAVPSGRVVLYAENNHQVVFGDDDGPLDNEEVVPLRRRYHSSLPRVFHEQDEAFEVADTLPPGFLCVWGRDLQNGRKGSKQYLVASLDDFWAYYRGVPEAARNFYEILRRISRQALLHCFAIMAVYILMLSQWCSL